MSFPETRLVESGWHDPPKPPKPPRSPKPPKPPKKNRVPKQKKVSKIDAKFVEWAQKNRIDLKDIPLMEKKK